MLPLPCREVRDAALSLGIRSPTLGLALWDLRCEIREALLRFLRDAHPEWLVRQRLQMSTPEALPSPQGDPVP